MNSFIVCIFICLAILNGYFTVDFNCADRPGWKNNIDKKFKKQCVRYEQLPNACKGAHLAHVLSWSAICGIVENFFNKNKFSLMRSMVINLWLKYGSIVSEKRRKLFLIERIWEKLS